MEQNIYNRGMFNCHYLQRLAHRIDVWYTVYANIWGILMANVTIYSIHGSYGTWELGPEKGETNIDYVIDYVIDVENGLF